MSSTFHKIADKLTGKDKEHDNTHSSNYGPHSSAAANKVDPKVDSDLDGRNNPSSRAGGYGNTQAVDQYGSATGPGGIASSDTYTSNTNNPSNNNPSSTNYGPHSSNFANTVDPRVDSDRDGRNNPTSQVGGYGHTQNVSDGYSNASGPGGIGSTTSRYGTHGTDSAHAGTGHGTNTSTNAGPHSSNLANKLDPRVDSDRDGQSGIGSNTGAYGQTHNTSTTGYNTTGAPTGTGHNTHGTAGNHGANPNYNDSHSTNTGPHSSNLLNKLDPRVDSDRDGRNDPTSRTGGYGETQTGAGYGTAQTTSHGTTPTHNATTAEGYTGSNTAHNDPKSTNTGPHSSNLLNKLDPRVDSDNDGRNDPTSKSGGYGQTQTGHSDHTVARY